MDYSIKEVSKKFTISPYTLRFYEKEGLIPSVKRNENGIRCYTEEDLGWIQMILCMKATGMSNSYIKNYLNLCAMGTNSLPKRRKMMFDQKHLIEEQIRKDKEFLEVITKKIDYYDEKISREQLKNYLMEKQN